MYRSRALANERHPLAASHYAPDLDLLVGVEDAITTIESFPSSRSTTSQCHRTGQVGAPLAHPESGRGSSSLQLSSWEPLLTRLVVSSRTGVFRYLLLKHIEVGYAIGNLRTNVLCLLTFAQLGWPQLFCMAKMLLQSLDGALLARELLDRNICQLLFGSHLAKVVAPSLFAE